MRTVFSWFVFLVVFAICVLPFVLYQMAERRGDVDALTPIGVGVFAAVSGLIGMTVAGWAAQAVRDAKISGNTCIRIPQLASTRLGAVQLLFAGLGIAFISFALQHYPIYRDLVDHRLEYDLEEFFQAGWLIYVGGLMAIYGGYRLVARSESGGD
jgi:hypothetical protein